MPAEVLERAVDHMHAWAAASETVSDRQLLDRFTARRDEAAFAALVHRHGPLVLSVCRRMLGSRHDAEDALQATFLILARRAGSIRKKTSLGSWLHGVAMRVAFNLRRRRQRQLRHEAAAARPGEVRSVDAPSWPEVQAVLHEELHRLAEKYRAPLVLCYLEGKSRDEAALELGCSLGRLRGRLERGRKALHARLVARGLPLSAALAATLICAEKVSAATVVLLSRAAANAAGAMELAPAVLQLAQEAGRTSAARLLHLGAAAALAACLALGAMFGSGSAAQDQQPGPEPAAKAPGSRIVVGAVLEPIAGAIISVDPATGAWQKLADADAMETRVSPDGQTVLYRTADAVWNCDTGGANNPGKLFDWHDGYGGFTWTSDSKHIVGTHLDSILGSEIWHHRTWRYDAFGRNPETLKIPATDAVLDLSRDGQWALTRARWLTRLNQSDLKIMKFDGSEPRQLSDSGGFNEPARFSPDSKRVAWRRSFKGDEAIWVASTDGTGKKKVFTEPGSHLHSLCWSPDGKTLAVVLGAYSTGPDGRRNRIVFGPEGKWRIELVAVDGDERRTVPIKANVLSLRDPDWHLVRTQDGAGERKPIQAAIDKAVTFLKGAQADGHWEPAGTASHRGGHTCLALWALLEAGVAPDDPAVARGLKYLRELAPASTYVVGLQTQVFFRAGLAEDRDRIQRNAAWLAGTMVRDDQGRGVGWSYITNNAPISDNSNTQYAVMGLHAAARAGAAIDAKVWREVKDYYLRAQHEDGGWGYTAPTVQRFGGPAASKSTLSMTCAGISGLLIAHRQLKEEPPATLANGWRRLGELREANIDHVLFYALHSLSRTGTLAGKATITDAKQAVWDWHADGARRLLAMQQADGSWRSPSPMENHPVIASSFGVLFLAAKK
jgi:RNA polymerase sigma factor (sigma-70 family)